MYFISDLNRSSVSANTKISAALQTHEIETENDCTLVKTGLPLELVDDCLIKVFRYM